MPFKLAGCMSWRHKLARLTRANYGTRAGVLRNKSIETEHASFGQGDKRSVATCRADLEKIRGSVSEFTDESPNRIDAQKARAFASRPARWSNRRRLTACIATASACAPQSAPSFARESTGKSPDRARAARTQLPTSVSERPTAGGRCDAGACVRSE